MPTRQQERYNRFIELRDFIWQRDAGRWDETSEQEVSEVIEIARDHFTDTIADPKTRAVIAMKDFAESVSR